MDAAGLIAAVRAEHGVSLQPDDPILVAATINRVAVEATKAELQGVCGDLTAIRAEIGKAVEDIREKRESVFTPQERSRLITDAGNRVAYEAEKAITALGPTIKHGATWRAIAGALAVFGLGLGLGLWLMHEEVAVANRRADNVEAHIHETETALKAAFGGGHTDADAWLKLMSWNRADVSLAQCTGRAVYVQDGRRVCAMPMWIEPPKSPQPNG